MSLDYVDMVMKLLLGLSFFLYGMHALEKALRRVAGNRMKVVLGKATDNKFVGLGTGTIVTALLQSSSVTTVLAVSFVSAGLMTFGQSIAVVMGANIGTTITAQIVAFKATALAPIMIIIGFVPYFFLEDGKVKEIGRSIMGLGIIFFGMGIMSEAMTPLRGYQPAIDFMASLDAPLMGIAVAAAFTALIQSSSATTGIALVLAGSGLITLEAGIALSLGANVGTCATAGLASIGKPRAAVRVAIVHVIFNVVGVLVWLFFIPQLVAMSSYLSDDVTRQIANSHTIFNVANAAVMIFFTAPFAVLVMKILPETKEEILEREVIVDE